MSPRLVKSAGKLLDNSNFQFIKSLEDNHLAQSQQKPAVRKQRLVSAGFGSGAPGGGSDNWRSRPTQPGVRNRADNYDSDDNLGYKSRDIQRSAIQRSKSPSAYLVRDPPVHAVMKSVTSSNTRRDIVTRNPGSHSELETGHGQVIPREHEVVLRKAFNIPSKHNHRYENVIAKDKPRVANSYSASAVKPRQVDKPSVARFYSPVSRMVTCQRCDRQVYQAEQVKAAGATWHKTCFLCMNCDRRLDSNSLCERGGQIFCNNCYHKNYGPRGIGFGIGVNFQT